MVSFSCYYCFAEGHLVDRITMAHFLQKDEVIGSLVFFFQSLV